ncbi:MAG: MFS transporter [bacterium]
MEGELREAASLPIEATRGIWRAFRHRNFNLFFFGQLISMIGTWSQTLALSWLVWQLTHSAIWLGVIGFTIQFPILVFGLPGGAMADRFDRLRSLTLMQTLCMLQALALAALTIMGRIELWQVVALSFALGSVYSFEFPIRQAFVMDIVGKRDLLNAVSMTAAMFHFTRILGPTVAGAIVAWKGEGICFLFNAATFLALITALAFVDRSKMQPVKRASEPLGRAIMEGLRHMSSVPAAKLSLVLVAVLAGIGMQFTTLMPIFADKVYGGGAVQLGWLMGASGIGALSGAFWLARRASSERLLLLAAVSGVIFSLSLIAFGIVPTILAALPILVIMGLCLTLAFSSVGTLLQHRTPDHLRGRMMSLFTITFMGVGPFGSILAGVLAKAIGAQITLAACGAFCLMVGLFVLYRARSIDS